MLARSLTYNLSSIVEDGIGKADHLFISRFGWNVRDIRVLRLVRATPGITFTDLASATKFERSLTSRILSRLIKSGLITRTNSGQDARVFTLHITAAGDAVCTRADPMTLQLEELVLEPLSESERAAFHDMIRRVRVWIESDYASEVERLFPAGNSLKKTGKTK